MPLHHSTDGKATTNGKGRRRLLRAGVTAVAAASALCLAGSNAMAADTQAASFTLSQGDWYPGSSYAVGSGYSGSTYLTTTLTFRSDGNLVLIQNDGDQPAVVWASGTANKGVVRLDWSQSGYVKLLNSSGGTVCTMGALNPAPGGHAEVQGDGNLVFYNTSGHATWSTGTYGDRVGAPGANLNYCFT
ncbi:hypothetical protein ACFW1A_04630 [Kitasatospora sp. NPDC058965]|uniref:hypothetical protein n=1 Tax=Kitasatospora sp. NPDC058965 TaxID=3346682 RepID=UPI00367542CC